jgi:hypothetical protein
MFNRFLTAVHIRTPSLMNKYQQVYKLCDLMTRSPPGVRPDCDEILAQNYLWTLNKNELELEDKMKDFLEAKKGDENFTIYSIINSKLEPNYSEVPS